MKHPRDKRLETKLLTLSDRYHATQDQAARAALRHEYRTLHARWTQGRP